MGIWAELKKSVNSTIGTDEMRPLDEILKNTTLVKSIQRGTITMTEVTATATITSVNTSKAVVIYGGSTLRTGVGTSTTSNAWDARLTLTNSTTVTADKSYSGSSSTSYVNYQVIEFY